MAQTRKPIDREAPPPAPLWVKAAGGIVVALLLLLVVLHLTGNSPGMHGDAMPPAEHSGQQP